MPQRCKKPLNPSQRQINNFGMMPVEAIDDPAFAAERSQQRLAAADGAARINAPTLHIPGFTHPVSEYWLEDVLAILENDKVAIVADKEHFYGLITRIDVINFLRKQLP